MNELLIHMNTAIGKTAEALYEVKNAITVIDVCKGESEQLAAIQKELDAQLNALKSLHAHYAAQKTGYLKVTQERRQKIQELMKEIGKQ